MFVGHVVFQVREVAREGTKVTLILWSLYPRLNEPCGYHTNPLTRLLWHAHLQH